MQHTDTDTDTDTDIVSDNDSTELLRFGLHTTAAPACVTAACIHPSELRRATYPTAAPHTRTTTWFQLNAPLAFAQD